MISLRRFLVIVAATALCIPAVQTRASEHRASFTISLAQTGDIILTDQDIAAYVAEGHRLVLTEEGREKWESHVERDSTQDPPIPKLGGLNGKEFILTVDGVEMYRGHFWSFAMSRMTPGVKIYDTLDAPQGELLIGYDALENEESQDPRDRAEIIKIFEKLGKLQNPREGGSK
jgi:hypothetical protein